MEKLHESNWPPRQLANLPQPLVVSRNLTDTGQELLLSVRSVVIRRAPNFSSASCLSNDLSEKSLKTSRLISDSRDQLLWLSRRQAKLTLLVFSKIPTCALSMPSESPSCQRTSNWPEESEVNELKKFVPSSSLNGTSQCH